MEIWTWRHAHGDKIKRKTENRIQARAIFLNPFTVYTPYKRNFFIVCPFVDEETDGSFRLQTDYTD